MAVFLLYSPHMITKADKLIIDAAEQRFDDKREFQRNAAKTQRARDAETLAADAGRDRTDVQAQIGRPLTRLYLVKRLQSIIPDLYYERSLALASRGGLYRKGAFIVGLEHGISPEFSVMEPTPAGHGRVLMRGWRSILAQLIAKRYITVEDAENTFGILRGAESERWWSLTRC